MPTNNKSIQILRGNKSSLSNDLKKTILKPGQPFFDKDAKTLQVGDGSGVIGDDVPGSGGSNLATAPYVTVKDGAINDVKIADNAAIKGSKLADANGDTSSPSGITTSKIEDESITNAKIADGTITGDKISETTALKVKQFTVIQPAGSTNPYDGLVRAERGVTCGTWFVAGNDYIQSKYMPEYIYYHNVNNREGKLVFPERTLDSNGEIIATLNNIPKFQSINGNLYITTTP